MAAAAALLRPGELTDEQIQYDLSYACGGKFFDPSILSQHGYTPRAIAVARREADSALGTWRWKQNFVLRGLPANRYIISVKSNGTYPREDIPQIIYLIDNHGYVYVFQNIYGMRGNNTLYNNEFVEEPGFEEPLTPEEIDMIKDMPPYDLHFARKFRGHIARICGRGGEEQKPKPPASSGGAAAGAGGGAAAATVVRKEVNEDPSGLGGGRRKRRVKKTRRRK